MAQTIVDMLGMTMTGDQRPRGEITDYFQNDTTVSESTEVSEGDVLGFGSDRYRVVKGIGEFLYPALIPPTPVDGPVRVHCGLHKCLTMYQRKVYRSVSRVQRRMMFKQRGRRVGYMHFYHRIRDFHENMEAKSITSVSGQRIDLQSYSDIRIVRFIRDPRDLLVSGYHYHKRGAEQWTKVKDPKLKAYDEVNCGIPTALRPGESLMDFLNNVVLEQGLIAEIDVRRPHYHSMMSWDPSDPRVLTIRYEDMLGNEPEMFDHIGKHMGWGWIERADARRCARKYRAGGKTTVRKGHIRNPNPRQWTKHFTPELLDMFEAEFAPLLEAYGYPTGAEAHQLLADDNKNPA